MLMRTIQSYSPQRDVAFGPGLVKATCGRVLTLLRTAALKQPRHVANEIRTLQEILGRGGLRKLLCPSALKAYVDLAKPMCAALQLCMPFHPASKPELDELMRRLSKARPCLQQAAPRVRGQSLQQGRMSGQWPYTIQEWLSYCS